MLRGWGCPCGWWRVRLEKRMTHWMPVEYILGFPAAPLAHALINVGGRMYVPYPTLWYGQWSVWRQRPRKLMHFFFFFNPCCACARGVTTMKVNTSVCPMIMQHAFWCACMSSVSQYFTSCAIWNHDTLFAYRIYGITCMHICGAWDRSYTEVVVKDRDIDH